MGCYIMKNYYDECIGCGAKVQGKDEFFGECTVCHGYEAKKKNKKFLIARVSVDGGGTH